MLYIKNGRLYTQSFSFELPEDMCFVTDPPGVSPDTLIFETLDGKYQIEIGAWYKEESPEKQIIDFIEYASHVLVSDLIKIERGTLKGFGAHFRNTTWQEEYYEERLQFKLMMMDKTLSFSVLCMKHSPKMREMVFIALWNSLI